MCWVIIDLARQLVIGTNRERVLEYQGKLRLQWFTCVELGRQHCDDFAVMVKINLSQHTERVNGFSFRLDLLSWLLVVLTDVVARLIIAVLY